MSQIQVIDRNNILVPFTVRGVPYRLHLHRSGGWLLATAQVPTRIGPVQVQARVNEAALRAYVMQIARGDAARKLRAFVAAGDDAAVGGFFDDLGEFFTKTIPKEVNKVARTKVFQDVAKAIQSVSDHPAYNIAMAAVNVIPGYGQAISAGMGAAKVGAAGLSLLARSQAGDKKARAAVRTIGAAAKAGNPKAQKAFATLQALNGMPELQKGKPVPNLGGGGAGLAGMGVDQAAMAATEALGESLMPGFASRPEYEAMKGLYTVGKGLADAFTGGQASAAMGLGNLASSMLSAGEPITLTAGDDGVFRLAPRYRYNLPPPRVG